VIYRSRIPGLNRVSNRPKGEPKSSNGLLATGAQRLGIDSASSPYFQRLGNSVWGFGVTRGNCLANCANKPKKSVSGMSASPFLIRNGDSPGGAHTRCTTSAVEMKFCWGDEAVRGY